MQINDIKTLVARLGAIVDGWDEQSGAPAVERHIAASLLAELYEAVKFDTALAATEVTRVVAEPDTVEKTVELTPTEEEVSEVIDLSDIFGGSSDDEEAEIAPKEVVDEPIEEVVPKEVAEPEIESEPDEPIVEEAVEQEPIEEQSVEEEIEVEVEVAEEQPIVAEPETPAIDEVVVETQIEMQEEQSVVEEEQLAAEEAQPTVTEAEQPAETEQEKPAEPEEKQPAETEEEKPKSEQASLFDMEIVRRPRSSSGRRVIMSLYGESAAPSPREKKSREQAAEPTPETPAKPETSAAPVASQLSEQPTDEVPNAVSVAERIAAAQTEGSQVLGDVIGAGTTTLAEAVAASQPTVQTVQNDRVNSLRAAIGINDRFIMIRDLFGGDGAAFDRALDELDAFEDFNECLVYMSTYRWNPNSDGARMLMDLVTRKLL